MAVVWTPELLPEQRNKIENWFEYHQSNAGNIQKYMMIRQGAKVLAKIIFENTPTCADHTAALRKLREVVMTANASIACGGK